MFNAKFTTALIFLVIILSLSAVYANEDNIGEGITLNEDSQINSEIGNFTELSNIIEDASINSTLNLDKDYKYELSCHGEGIKVNKSISIDGNGHSINAMNKSRIFQFKDCNIILKNIQFINAFSSEAGGVIYAYNSTVGIINCTFTFNQANNSGGAVYSLSTKLNITNSTFLNNTCNGLYGEGGAIFTELSSKTTITDTKFYYNSADAGGAVNTFSSDISIKNCEFANNIACWYGGSIFSDSIINITSSSFHNNKAGLKGGAVHSTYCGLNSLCSLFIEDSIFLNNSAIYGGAVLSSNAQTELADSGKNTIINTQFYSNLADYGAVIAKLSVSEINMFNCSCVNNTAFNGSVIFSPCRGQITLDSCNFTQNTGDEGCIIYTIQGRFNGFESKSNITVNKCNILDNNADSLIYDFYGNIILKNSTLTYNEGQYPFLAISKSANGNIIFENNWWGVENPDFTKLIYINSNSTINMSFDEDLKDIGDCSSCVIQIDETHTVISFRRDSSSKIPIFIDFNNEIRQEKFDTTYFIHALITSDGWTIGSGGLDGPYESEKMEAIAKIMIKNNEISKNYLDIIYNLKSLGNNFGHFLIKAPDGRYGVADYFKGSSAIETGVLKSGEYIVCPNNYSMHMIGNVSDLNQPDYATASRYLLGIDQYSHLKTTIQTYEYKKETNGSDFVSYLDCYVSNDDGHLANKSDSSNLFNDIVVGREYILGENIPIIMDGMYVTTFVLNAVPLISSKLTVNNIKTTYNKGEYLTATLKDVGGKAIENAVLKVTLNGKIHTLTTDNNGEVKLFVKLSPNTYNAIITFNGDNKYLNSTATSKITVKKETVKIVNAKKTYKFKKSKSKKIKVTLKNSQNKAINNVKLTLKLTGNHIKGKKTITVKTNKKGTAIFKLKNKFKNKTRVKFTITYKGNAYFTKTVKKGNIIIR